jgi:DNA-binding CsgD family transcriptional regulator
VTSRNFKLRSSQASRSHRSRSDRAAQPVTNATVPAPPGLDVFQFRLDSEDYVLLSFDRAAETEARELTQLLTPAESDVAARVLRGQSNAQIARERGTSLATIACQLVAIYRKLGVRSRRELAARRLSHRGDPPTNC